MNISVRFFCVALGGISRKSRFGNACSITDPSYFVSPHNVFSFFLFLSQYTITARTTNGFDFVFSDDDIFAFCFARNALLTRDGLPVSFVRDEATQKSVLSVCALRVN